MSKSGEKILAGAAEALAFARGKRAADASEEAVLLRRIAAKLDRLQAALDARTQVLDRIQRTMDEFEARRRTR